MYKTSNYGQKMSEAIEYLHQIRSTILELFQKYEECLCELNNGLVNSKNSNYDCQEYLDETQVSRLTGIPKGTLQQRRTKHQDPSFIKVGRSVRYKRQVILDWLESNVSYSDNDLRKGYKPR